MICPNCQSDNRDTAKFCDNCGTALALICDNCGTENRPGAKFCDNCGYKLAGGDEGGATGSRNLAVSPDLAAAAEPQPAPAASDSSQLLPPELAAKLDSARRSGTMEGERRVVTMLFCDVVGSTAASGQLDPEEWTEVMNGAFDFMIKPIYHFEGTVARLMGDAILAFFGAPIAHEDDPQRAVLAGLEIVRDIQHYRREIKSRWSVDLNVRVGINTGLVVVGAVGSDMRLEYTAMGDAINLAARMEQTAEPGTVQIAEETFRLVAPVFETKALGGIVVKGKSLPVPSYQVLGRKAAPSPLRGIEGLDAPLVGRTSEWQRLEDTAAKLERGLGGILLLVGEAGLGKSRLINELKARVQNRPTSCAWHETATLSYETSRPYALFQRLMRRLVGATAGDPPDQLSEKLEALVGAIAGEEAAAVRPVFNALFNLAQTDGQTPLEGEAFKGRLFTVMGKLWRQQAERQPTVLVFDDLHWSDPASVALLLHLLPLTAEVPLLILGATRPESGAPGWQVKLTAERDFNEQYMEIALQALSEADSGELVDRLLTISNLPPQLRAQILYKSEGNPFFVEEVVRTLIDSGAVIHDEKGRTWRASGAGEVIDIPGNVQSLLTARIDRLEAGARDTLQLAAVVGRNFYYRVLAHVARIGSDLDDQLLTLRRSQLIQEYSRLPELEYIFRHALTQEAAYSTILLRRRRIFHGRIGQALEELFPDQQEELAGGLARHFYLARDYERGLRYYALAGDVAFRQFAAQEAIESYSKAIECSEKVEQIGSEQLIHLYRRRGRAYELSNQFNDALDNYQRMVMLAQERDNKALLLSALTSQCILFGGQSPLHDPPRAQKLGEEALQLARELGDRAAEARVLWALMLSIAMGGGDNLRALAFGQESLAICRELGLTEQMGYTLHNLANIYQSLDRIEESLQAALDARAVWVALKNTPMLADSYSLTSNVTLIGGDYETTITDAKEMLRLGQSIGNSWTQTVAYLYSGPSLTEQGVFGQAYQAFHQALDLAQKAGITTYQDIISGNLIYLYLSSGAFDRAQPLAEELYRERERLIFGFSSVILSRIALLKIAQDDLAQAEQIIMEAQAGVDLETAMLFFVAAILVAKAILGLAQSRPQEALEDAQALAKRARQTGMHHFLPEALLIQGQAFAAMDKLDQAGDVLQDARSVAETIGQRRVLWQILAEMAEIEDRRGNGDTAGTYRDQARHVIDYIVEHSGSELRSSFLSMPEVQAIRESSGS